MVHKALFFAIFIILSAYPPTAAQQIILDEDFSDGDFTQNPEWIGTTDNWIVEEFQGSNVLRLNADEAGESHLSTESVANYGEWEFSVYHNGFNPSNVNRAHVFMIADRPNTSDGVNGYAVRVGQNMPGRTFRVVRFNDGTLTETIISGTTIIEQDTWYKVRVTRTEEGEWSLFLAVGPDGDFEQEGESAIDNTMANAAWFSIRPSYTIGNINRFIFDNIRVTKNPLTLAGVEVVDNQTLRAVFSEAIAPETVLADAFTVDGPEGSFGPDQVDLAEDNVAELLFNEELPSGSYTLSVEGIEDLAGFVMDPATLPFEIVDLPEPGDIIINEFFYNEPGNFPQYVELFNNSDKFLNLNSWRIQDNTSTTRRLTTEDFTLAPNGFVVLTGNAAGMAERFGDRPYLELSNFPSLNRASADQIKIFTDAEVLMDSLTYEPSSWGGENAALERRSADAISYAQENWMDSTNPLSGTPGLPNTADPDPDPIILTSISYSDSQTLEARFDRHIDRASAENPANFTFEGAISISNLEKTDSNVVTLSLSLSMISNTEYTVSARDIESIFGVPMPEQSFSFTYFEIEPVEPGDVFINEFMYDVAPDYSRYIELYNASEKALDLHEWTSNNDTGNRRIITNDSVLLPPDSYIILAPDNQLLDIFPDLNLINMGSRFSALKLAGDDIVIRDSEGMLIDSLRYRPDWGGDEVALERRSVEAISYAQDNWVDSTHPLLGTPGQPNTAEPVQTPLVFTEILYDDAQTVRARFDRHIDRTTAENPANFTFEGSIGISNLEKTAANEVTLSLDLAMIRNTGYTISARDIESIFGVPMNEQSLSFTYFEIEPADSGDVFINEFMYDVAPDFSRYIELYNASDKALNMLDWTSNNNTGNRRTITSEPVIFPPESYIILAPDDQLLDIFPDLRLINMGSRFSALKTSGDDIVIRDADGMLIDSLRYLPGWGGDEVALERRTIEAAAFYQENWGDSPSPQLGTPGQPNLIEPDFTPPEFISATAALPELLTLIFSKSMDPEAAQNPENYIISPNVPISSITAEGSVVNVQTASPFQTGTTYTITLQNLTDIFGNTLGEVTASFTFLEFESPEFGDIVVNEFLYRPMAGETPRFVELYNRSDRNINLEGWRLGRSNATIQLSGPGGIIPLAAGAYIVVTDQPSLLGLSPAQTAQVGSMLALSQNGDSVFLRDETDMLIDSLRYSPSWGGSPAGFSLERLDPEAASNDPTNWATHPSGNSAGEQNAVFQPNETPPRVIFAQRTADNRVEVRFSEFVRPDSESGFSLNGTPLQIDAFNPFEGNRVLLNSSTTDGTNSGTHDFGEEDEIIRINRLSDVPGNEASDLSTPIAQPLLPGDVVINEIMFQPFSDSRNDFPDQSEYLELYNRRAYAVNMEGFFIHKAPDRDENLSSIHPVTTESGWIPAGGFGLMYADPSSAFSDSRIAQFFGIEEPAQRRFFRADRSTLSLSVSEDAVFLAKADSTVIDSVFYSSSWHNPNLVDTRGISIERIDPFGASNSGENWGSSVLPEGGTPGKLNSLFQTPQTRPERQGIVLEPNPFSPDDDGRDDNLFINYTLDQPDYLLRVRIFDRHGRLVRTLADGRAAGLEGTLTWDGRRDNGMENRIGIYIILFEAYNSSSGNNITFRETVVLARQL